MKNFDTLKIIINEFCCGLDEKLDFIISNLKMMKQEPQKSQVLIEELQSEFEIEDNLTILVLQTIFGKLVMGDSFTM